MLQIDGFLLKIRTYNLSRRWGYRLLLLGVLLLLGLLTQSLPRSADNSHLARVPDKREVAAWRTEYSRHYDLGEGRYVALVSPSPQNYLDAAGRWQPTNPGFVAFDGGWQVQRNSLQSTVGMKSTTVQLESRGQRLEWQPQGLQLRTANGDSQPLATPLMTVEAMPGRLAEDGLTLTFDHAWSDPQLSEQLQSGPGFMKQSLILSQPPRAVLEAEWLELEARLNLPQGATLFANGQVQTGEFVTEGRLEIRSAEGESLLIFEPPLAHEQKNRLQQVAGRYRVRPAGSSVTLFVQTPWSWWADPARQYPAFLDPTMGVVQDELNGYIRFREAVDGDGNGTGELDENAITAGIGTCVGHFVDNGIRSYQRAYVRFPLPNLPLGQDLHHATFVAVPDPELGGSDPNFELEGTLYSILTNQLTTLYQMPGEDWITAVDAGFVAADSIPEGGQSAGTELLTKYSPDDPDSGEPVSNTLGGTTWDVTSIVESWYDDPGSNFGLGLQLANEGFYFYEDEIPDEGHPTFMCFPLESTIPYTAVYDGDPIGNFGVAPGGAGMILLISYHRATLPLDTLQTSPVPSNLPAGTFRFQHQEYIVPAYSDRWRLVAAQGEDQSGEPIANTPLELRDASGGGTWETDLPITSEAGAAPSDQDVYSYRQNYFALNGHQSWMSGERILSVLPDGSPAANHNDKTYHLQMRDALPSPIIPDPGPMGYSTTVDLTLEEDLIAGQEFDLNANTTVEIQVTCREIHARLFPPSASYGSRDVEGIDLARNPHPVGIEAPEACEIEFPVQPDTEGPWLLVLNSDEGPWNGGAPARITVCQNDADVVRYPVDGVCVELHRPDDDDSHYQSVGNVRVFSPAGFSGGDCATGCTTVDTDPVSNQPVMPLLGWVGDDDNWVAIKGGTLTLSTDPPSLVISPGARLLMVDFSDPTEIASLPVLRGDFVVDTNSGLISEAGVEAELLVNNPLPERDQENPWDYEIDLQAALMRASGTIERRVQPTPGEAETTFNLNAEWSINAHGAPSLQGTVELDSVSPLPIHVGVLLLSPPQGSNYALEYDPDEAETAVPAALPIFRQVRMQGATLAQPADLGGAQVSVQAVILNPGVEFSSDGSTLHRGDSVLDLRGPTDAIDHIDRDYHMPDLIIQDQANTMMFNTPGGVQILSSDHPLARSQFDGASFSYEAFNATVQTRTGKCPGPINGLTGEPDPDLSVDSVTIIEGDASIALPNMGGSGVDTNEAPEINAHFILCENALRKISLTFDSGSTAALPLGNSGLYLSYLAGTVTLAPKTETEDPYTTIRIEVHMHGTAPSQAASNLFIKGWVTIDTRGLFDMQAKSTLRVVGNLGAGIDGHFWVGFLPLDIGFEMRKCIPYGGGSFTEFSPPAQTNEFDGTDADPWLCSGDELIYGLVRAHMWRGQGWQNRYDYLPDDDALHIAAQYIARFNLTEGMIVDWNLVKIPPQTITLKEIELALGEFCINDSCTEYEWGVLGTFGYLGLEIGAYYGFESSLHFIIGSSDYTLIDDVGQAVARGPVQLRQQPTTQQVDQVQIRVEPGLSSVLFGVAWTGEQPGFTLVEPPPGNRMIDSDSVFADVTTTISPTSVGFIQTIAVANPLPGDWQVNIDDRQGETRQFNLFHFANNPAPKVDLEVIGPNPLTETTAIINWTSNVAPGDDFRISLYYEIPHAQFAAKDWAEIGGPIVEHLPLTPNGSYAWDLRGLYGGSVDYPIRVYARIENNAAAVINRCGNQHYNPDPTAQSCGTMLNPALALPIGRMDAPEPIIYIDATRPAAPTLDNVRAEGLTSVVARWLPNQEPDLAGYLVTCQQAGLERQMRVPAQVPGASSLHETARVNGLNPGQEAACFVQAYDATGNLSLASATGSAITTGDVPAPPAAPGAVVFGIPAPGGVAFNWNPVSDVAGYLLYYQPSLTATVAKGAAQEASNSDIRDTYQANEGPSPLDVGAVTSSTLTGLRPGTTYQVWVRAYDADGRTGKRSPAATVTVPDSEPPDNLIFLPLVAR